MRSNHAREIVHQFEVVIDLLEAGQVHSERVVIEDDVLNALNCWPLRENARISLRIEESLGRERRTDSSQRRTQIVSVAHEGVVELVHRLRAEGLRVTDGE